MSLILFRNILNRFLHKLAIVIPGGYSMRPWLHYLCGTKMGKKVWISQYVYFDELHPEAITIGDNTSIGLRVSIFTHFYWGYRKDTGFGNVIIGKNVFVGPHCVILPNVHIGDGAVIKAGTVVSKDVPPYTLWGVPSATSLGRVTVPLTSENSYDDFVRGLKPVRDDINNMEPNR